MTRKVDLNADVGEGLDDEALMPHLTSVSVACGGHTGDRESMKTTLEAARRRGLRAGAHLSYPDRDGFGRVDISVGAEELAASLHEQLSALHQIAAQVGVSLTHVKAHGALYNSAWQDRALADVVAGTVAAFDRALALFCPGGSEQEAAAAAAGVAVVREVFLDRGYSRRGTLVARGEPGDILHDPVALAEQISNLSGLEFETMCVHGDNPAALDLLRATPALFAERDWRVEPYSIGD